MLQGPKPLADDPELNKLVAGMEARGFISAKLPNCRKDGAHFTNLLSVVPFIDHTNHLVKFLGVQCDQVEKSDDPEHFENKWTEQVRLRPGSTHAWLLISCNPTYDALRVHSSHCRV